MARLTPEQIAATGITLKKLSVNQRLSEETLCFTADVYINGKREGMVSNRGHGGCDDYHPWELGDKLNAIAATLPHFDLSEGIGFTGMDDEQRERLRDTAWDAELLIGAIVNVVQAEKQLARMLKGRIVMLMGKEIRSAKAVPGEIAALATQPDFVERTKARFKADAVLNTMPPADALATFLAHT
jgi:hypothetical protein